MGAARGPALELDSVDVMFEVCGRALDAWEAS
jgi:hypothetical protein